MLLAPFSYLNRRPGPAPARVLALTISGTTYVLTISDNILTLK